MNTRQKFDAQIMKVVQAYDQLTAKEREEVLQMHAQRLREIQNGEMAEYR